LRRGRGWRRLLESLLLDEAGEMPPPASSATGKRILIVSDAWHPQVAGYVRTLTMTARELMAMGHTVKVIGPSEFRTIPLPTYPDIPLALFPGRKLGQMIEAFGPEHLHIATEGTLGWSARRWALRRGFRFTTAFHTKFPEYVQARSKIPPGLTYAILRRFHESGAGTMVATASLTADLQQRGFTKIRRWSRGVDLSAFRPEPRRVFDLPGPIFVYVGRVAVEKNIRAFLDLDLPGSKVVVGEGPQLAELRSAYPNVHFAGALFGPELASAYAGGDVFVFPSRTDTFGLVLLEALACGTPVAAYPVTGPVDVLAEAPPSVGSLAEDLRSAALRALADGNRSACRDFVTRYSWRACTEMFLGNLVALQG
jgi:glycosyltransferase involved in cell wall biosynthesis